MPQLRLYLTIIQIVSYSLVLMNLFRSGLWRRYRYFCFYIAFEMLRVPTMLAIPFRSKLYGRLFFATQPIAWIFFVLVVLELFQLVLRNHAGIATLGKKTLTWSLVLSVVISAATLLIELQEIRPESAFLVNFILLDRLVMSSLLVLLLCLIVFLTYFPVPLVRNIRVHASIFSAYFAVRTTVLFVVTLFGLETVRIVNIVGQMLAIACLVSWIILLKPTGETVPVRQRPSSEQEARLLAQLEALNETLLRSARK